MPPKYLALVKLRGKRWTTYRRDMKRVVKKLKEKKGFTLVESVVSIAILAITGLAFATFLASSNRMTVLSVLNAKDFAILQEAIASGDYDGLEIDCQTEKGKKFTISFKNDDIRDIEVKGEYIVVTNKKTGNRFVIFNRTEKTNEENP